MYINLKNKTELTLIILIILTLSFIFGQSMLPPSLSIAESDGVAGTVDKIFDSLVKDENNGSQPPETPPTADSGSSDTSGDSSVGGGDSSEGEVTPPSGGTGDSSDTPGDSAGDEETPPSDGAGDSSDIPGDSTGDEETPPSDDIPDIEEPEREKGPFETFLITNIRKIAHFFEHGILGLEIFFLLLAIERDVGLKRKILPMGIKALLFSINIGILVAFFDESIQILSGRTYSMLDVWLDVSGYASFTLILTLIYTVIKSMKYLFLRKAKESV